MLVTPGGFAIYGSCTGATLIQEIPDPDRKSRIDSNRDISIERIKAGVTVVFVAVDDNLFLGWIYDPVFPDTGLGIDHVLQAVVHFAAGRGDNLENEIWGSGASAVGQLIWIADHRDIRFHPVLVIGIEIDGEGGRVYLAGSVVIGDMLIKESS